MFQYVMEPIITAKQMKDARKKLGLTQKELAEFLGVSKPTVERWETSVQPIKGPVARVLQILTPEELESITIAEKKLPLRLWYMYGKRVCTIIDVDERKQIVKIKNYVASRQFRAFGLNETPSFQDYEEFLESRCFPKERDKMKLILKDLNLPFYDPLLIIEKTQGRMAEDDFWIKVER